MSRLPDFVTCYSVSGTSNATGENVGSAIPISGTHAMAAIDYTKGTETSITLQFEIGETSSGPWYRLRNSNGGNAAFDTITATAAYAYSLSHIGAGEALHLAGPWIRPIVVVDGTTGVATEVAVKLAFSGSGY